MTSDSDSNPNCQMQEWDLNPSLYLLIEYVNEPQGNHFTGGELVKLCVADLWP